MKKMRWLSAGVSVLLIAAMLMGCGAQNGSTETKDQTQPNATDVEIKTQASDAEVFPITEQEFTLKIMAGEDSNIDNIETNEFTAEYQEKTNVKVDWEWVPSKSIPEKLNLVLGTQEDMPDVFLHLSLSNEQVMSYGVDQGVFVDLTPYIEKYAPNIQKMLDYNPQIRQAVTAPNGAIYALPSFEETMHTQYPQKAWIYKPWLDKLGLEVPNTPEELEAVLTAFKEQDPNGNGKQDEIPMTGATTGWLNKPVGYLMSAFIYYDQDNQFNVDDEGNVTVPYNTPEWREGLTYMNRLCEKGLLDPQAFVQDQNQLKQATMIDGDNIVGVVTSGATGGFMNVGHERQKEWIALPPLENKNGECVTATRTFKVGLGQFAVSTTCPDPAVAVRWVDYFFSQEGCLRATCGVEGRDWRYAEEGELGINGKPGVYAKILAFGKKQNVHWNKLIPVFKPEALRSGLVDISPEGTNIEEYLYNVTKELYADHGVKNTMQPLFFSLEDVEQINESLYLINDYVPEAYSKFIIGEWDIDDDAKWQEYLATLDSMGLQEMVAKYDETYKAQYMK